MTIQILQLVNLIKQLIDNIVLMFNDDDIVLLRQEIKLILTKIEEIEKLVKE